MKSKYMNINLNEKVEFYEKLLQYEIELYNIKEELNIKENFLFFPDHPVRGKGRSARRYLRRPILNSPFL